MKPTQYNEINTLLEKLSINIQAVLESRLVGFYLFGSLVWGDFDMDISDIDLLVVTSTDLTSEEFKELDIMQNLFTQNLKEWDNRIEIAYFSTMAMRNFKNQSNQVALISPGEPFHIKEAGIDWLINLYLVREQGITLFGENPKTLITPISKEEFIGAVMKQVMEWREYIIHTKYSRPYQGFAILSMCRALYVIRNGEQVSKKKAAEWAMEELPEWAGQIKKALLWREEYQREDIVHEATYPESVQFINYCIDLITRKKIN